MAFGNVPNCGASAGRSTGLFMSDGTDSVRRILATRREMVIDQVTDEVTDEVTDTSDGRERKRLTWEEGDPTGWSFLCALVVAL